MATALNLYKKYTKSELVDLARAIEENKDNHELPDVGIHTLNLNARKKIAAINQAIAWHLDDDRNRSNNPVPTCGYSGRTTNRS